ncbi:MAG: 50S ribosomal protein L24 [Clostridia bacterium]|nr:50S ribosomal protein L24 [Clostridia bacterium]
MKLHVKAKDQVIVISGQDKGTKGTVVTALPKTGKVVVEGVNMVTKHQKPRGQGMPGGIIKQEAAIDASNVMLVCKKCGRPARVAIKVNADGSKTRICKKCHEQID